MMPAAVLLPGNTHHPRSRMQVTGTMSHRCCEPLLEDSAGLKSIHIYDRNEHLDNGNQESGSMDRVLCNVIFMAQDKDELTERDLEAERWEMWESRL